jgi:hypothetical protein
MRNLVAAIAAMVLAWPSGAKAQNNVAADAAFREGRSLMQAGRYEEACTKFEYSYSEEPAVGTLLNLADCHEKVNRLATAWVEFTEASERAAHDGQQARAAEAKRRAAVLEPRLARLQITAPEPRAQGITILRDSTEVTSLIGVAVPVDPGDHVIIVKRGDLELWRRAIKVQGEGVTSTVELPSAAELDAAEAAQKKTNAGGTQPANVDLSSAPAKPRLDTRRMLAIGAGAVGVVSLGMTLGFGIAAKSARDTSRENCTNNVCNELGFQQGKAAQTRATVADVFGVLSVVAIGGGAVLWFTAPKRDEGEHERAAPRVTPVIGTSQVGLVLEGGF